jgi:hypothetical protein
LEQRFCRTAASIVNDMCAAGRDLVTISEELAGAAKPTSQRFESLLERARTIREKSESLRAALRNHRAEHGC